MYNEEFLPDDANDYFDMSDVSIEESSSIDTELRDHRKMKEVYKRMDKDYYSYKIMAYDNDMMKPQKIELYSSPLFSNGLIRNAATGIRMEHRVGSKYDDLYFIMKDVTTGTKTPLNTDSRKLYYNNPEECERHQKIRISQPIKEIWQEKNLRARARFY